MNDLTAPFRDGTMARPFVERIRRRAAELGRPVRLMEVCGTHTVAISRSGLRSLLAGAADLVSGPGCPVCVTADWEIDRMLAYCDVPDAIVCTYGDLLKVPGSGGSLADRRAAGADVRVVYSAMDALALAQENSGRPVIFLGIGFETTAPAAALALATAADLGVRNFYVHSVHKLTPPAMRALLAGGGAQIDGFICPGHVSTVLGEEGFAFLAKEFGLPAAIAGFEPLDILMAVDYLVDAALGAQPVRLENTYKRWVRPEGNPRARQLIAQAFEPCDARWRGLGVIPGSGLAFRESYAAYDAERAFPAEVPEPAPRKGCRCGQVLRGELKPTECGLFGTACVPEHPLGPCMVSGEGACAAYYRYGEDWGPVPAPGALGKGG
ncbi:MAG TPA: hydrogenase formation protein HypD [Symbiobacteriaceae bacterium]|nr:hydrogenase formation protein HypD [Symbiobacteriaceae bacterium]